MFLVVGVEILAVLAKLLFLFLLVADHGVFDVAAHSLDTLLRGEAYAPEHAGMLEGLADDDAHLVVIEVSDAGRILIAALHELDEAIRQDRLDAPDTLASTVARIEDVALALEVDLIASGQARQHVAPRQVYEICEACLAGFFDEEAWVDALLGGTPRRVAVFELGKAVEILAGDIVGRLDLQCVGICLLRLSVVADFAERLAKTVQCAEVVW